MIMTRLGRRVLILSLLLTGLIAALVLAVLSEMTPKNEDCPGVSPEVVVRSYYTAAVRGDGKVAQTCLTTAYRQDLASVVDPDWQNIRSIRLTSVKEIPLAPVRRPTVDQPPFRTAGLRVEYSVIWRRFTTDENGPGVRFISVLQENPNSPWRIDSIGSGP